MTLKPLVLDQRDFYISKIIDARNNKTEVIGEIHKRFSEKYKKVVFQKGLKRTISDYLTYSQLTKSTYAQSTPIILKIKDCRFQHKIETDGMQFFTLQLTLEYYREDQSLIYATQIKTLNVKKIRDELFLNNINRSMFLFNLVDSDHNFTEKYNNGMIEITNSPLIKGFYGSYLEFKNNSPVFQYNFEIENIEENTYQERGNTNHLKINITDSGFKDDKDTFLSKIYGFSDGENVFIKDNMLTNKFGFVEIKPQYRYTIFDGKLSATNTTKAVLGGIAAGAIGGAVAGARYKGKFVIDIKTGDVFILNDNNLNKLINKYPGIANIFDQQPETKYEIKEYWIDQINQYIVSNENKNP
ncbi:MAG: hypothetical protein R3345_00455 [Fulvivirga sp.]|nr:hypothetical protein [Fulvivirga sp.]